MRDETDPVWLQLLTASPAESKSGSPNTGRKYESVGLTPADPGSQSKIQPRAEVPSQYSTATTMAAVHATPGATARTRAFAPLAPLAPPNTSIMSMARALEMNMFEHTRRSMGVTSPLSSPLPVPGDHLNSPPKPPPGTVGQPGSRAFNSRVASLYNL